MNVKKQIDDELQNIILPPDFDKRILQKNRSGKTTWKRQAAAVLLCFILGATSVYAGYYIYNRINVNEQTIPALQPMEKKKIKRLDAQKNEIGDYIKEYSSYDSLCSELGIKLLSSDLAENNPYMKIIRKTDNQNWNDIQVTAYITGDVQSLKKTEGEGFYSWSPGKEYFSPVDMTVEIITSDEQLEIGWEKDYLGLFEYEETYQSAEDYTVNILKDKSMTPKYYAIFVADGVRYTLSGQIKIEKMKEIVNSMH